MYKTDERESPQEAKPARENSSLGFIEAVQRLGVVFTIDILASLTGHFVKVPFSYIVCNIILGTSLSFIFNLKHLSGKTILKTS